MSPARKAAGWILAAALVAALPAAAQTWTISIGAGNAVSSTSLQTGKVGIITDSAATVTVQCASGVDCTKVGLQLESNGEVSTLITPTAPVAPGASSATFAIPNSAVISTGMDLVLTLGGAKIATYRVGTLPNSAANAANPGSGGGGGGAVLATLLQTSCPGTFTAGYDAKNNRGEIVVTPVGNVLATALQKFDENDTLIVKVVGDVELLPLLVVERTSAFRDVGTVRIVGGDQTLPAIARQAGGCGVQQFTLADFAPGQATVQISALQGTQKVPLGSFSFNVDPLFTGMFTLGGAWTDLVDPGFKLAANSSGQTVIAAGATGSRDLLYTLFYTPFVWGKRDLRKSVPWYQHLNPSIGVVPNDIRNNAMIGLSADLPAGIVLTIGRHFRKVTSLPSGLQVGTVFTGTADQIPTSKEWKNDNFWAVSIDLRAIVQLFKVAAGSTTAAGAQ